MNINKTKWILAIIITILSTNISFAEVGITKNEIKIGSIMDQSGPVAFIGKGIADGVRLYIKYINDKGGVHGRRLKFILEDDGYQAPRAVQACRKLIVRDKVFCMFAVIGSAANNAIYPILASRGIPLVLPATLNQFLVDPPRKYLFLAETTYTIQGKLAVEYVVEDMKVKKPRIACVYQDDIAGHDWRNGVRIGAKHYGLEILELSYKRAAVDFSSQIAKCKDAGITHILMWTFVREPAFIMKEAQRIQYKAVYICATPSTTKKVIDLAGDSIEYSKGFYATGTINDPMSVNNRTIKEFKKNIKKYKMCKVGSFENIYGYQATMTLVEALRRSGKNLTREGVIKALETFKNYDNGILPPITWGPNRRAGNDAVKIYKVIKGYWRPLGKWRYPKIKG